jgi:teichuronic acid biosynthesis glycosyltransferase TuaG
VFEADLDSGLDSELVSIITPVYNSELFIAETIESVRAQSYPKWEMLVLIDAGTNDRTAEITRQFATHDARIKLIHVPDGKNVSDARNYGFAMARGRYIAFLDADDLWLPEKLENQIAHLKANGAVLTYTGYRRISIDGKQVGREILVPDKLSYKDLLKHNPIACLTVLIDQEQSGPLRMGHDIHEDYVLWLKILRAGHSAVGLVQDLARYRIVTGSRSSNKLKMAHWRWQVYRDGEGLSICQASYFFAWYVVQTLVKHSRF